MSGTNSGIFLRVPSVDKSLRRNQIQMSAMEVQILDSYGKAKAGKHDCGAIYDCLAPSKNMVKPPGKWNRLTIFALANRISVVMNGRQIIDIKPLDK